LNLQFLKQDSDKEKILFPTPSQKSKEACMKYNRKRKINGESNKKT